MGAAAELGEAPQGVERGKEHGMSDVLHPTAISGVPESSLSARRIQPRAGGPAERLGTHLRKVPSLVVSWLVANVGAVILGGAMVGLGFYVTKVLISIPGFASADEQVPVWLAAHRTPFWTDVSQIGSAIAGGSVIVPLIGLTALVFVLRRRWRMASFVVQAGLAEALAYAVTVNFVHRARPPVAQLDTYNLSHSFPSCHVAASIAVYGALALLLTAHFRAAWVRIPIWTVAAAIPLVVAWSRMYRGEHHPTDVAAGVLMGLAALGVALLAARTARVAGTLRAQRRAAEGHS
jgi:membrane-associated phospholipid phosphatase